MQHHQGAVYFWLAIIVTINLFCVFSNLTNNYDSFLAGDRDRSFGDSLWL